MSQGRPPSEGLVLFIALMGLFVALFLLGVVAEGVVTPVKSVETALTPISSTLRV